MIPPSRSFIKNWKLSIKNLPKGKDELLKARKKNIPLFPYASEERFRDLFLALRADGTWGEQATPRSNRVRHAVLTATAVLLAYQTTLSLD